MIARRTFVHALALVLAGLAAGTTAPISTAARAAEPAAAPASPAVAPAGAGPEIARTAAFYNDASMRRSVPAANPAPVETLFDDMADAGPTDEQIIAFFAEHDMDIDEAVPRLERFIADVRAGALAAA